MDWVTDIVVDHVRDDFSTSMGWLFSDASWSHIKWEYEDHFELHAVYDTLYSIREQLYEIMGHYDD